MNSDNMIYEYSSLWNHKIYQEGASMHRVINAISFIKENMSNKIGSCQKSASSNQEVLHIAVLINNGWIQQRRKHSRSNISCTNSKTKSIDYFRGPYLDLFSEEQKIFAPCDKIISYY